MTASIVDRLLGCLAELDQQGFKIAAAHVDAAIHELVREASTGENSSEPDRN